MQTEHHMKRMDNAGDRFRRAERDLAAHAAALVRFGRLTDNPELRSLAAEYDEAHQAFVAEALKGAL
jgi:hypothetical protein